MSQFGKPRQIGKSIFAPRLDTEPRALPRRFDKIEAVILIHDHTDMQCEPCSADERATADSYIGKTYGDWLEIAT